METASIDVSADALLLHYTHDVLRSRRRNRAYLSCDKARCTRRDCRFKLPSIGAASSIPGIDIVRGLSEHFEGLQAPWDRLLPYIKYFQVYEEFFMGSGYIATARACGSMT